jgi:hypothetical protein
LTRSIEVRWFQRGVLPAAMSRWFVETLENGGDAYSRESRTDKYVVVPACEHVGLKYRSGTVLEIKWRQSVMGELHFTPTVLGRPEHWFKVSALSGVEGPDPTLDDRLIHSVVKHRTLRKYQHSVEGVVAVKPSLAVPAGATIEVTTIRLGADDWWTFGCEAFSTPAATDDDLSDTFYAVLRHVLSAYDGPRLAKEESYGYPRWLSQYIA